MRTKTMATSVETQVGKAELKVPLKYSSGKQQLSGTTRAKIDAWEAKRAKNKIEYGLAVDANGNPLGERRGGSGSVRYPMTLKDRAEVFTHNHPRTQDGVLGGSFSKADLQNFSYSQVQNYRAAAAEGTYFISKTASFNATKFNEYISKVNRESRNEYSTAYNKVAKDYKDGKISYDEYVKNSHTEFNTYLVNMHNKYLAGQKEYGYTYGLERR